MIGHFLEVWLVLLLAFGGGAAIGVSIHRILATSRFYRAQYRFAAAVARSFRRRTDRTRDRPAAAGRPPPMPVRVGMPAPIPVPEQAEDFWEEYEDGDPPPALVDYDEEDARWLAYNPDTLPLEEDEHQTDAARDDPIVEGDGYPDFPEGEGAAPAPDDDSKDEEPSEEEPADGSDSPAVEAPEADAEPDVPALGPSAPASRPPVLPATQSPRDQGDARRVKAGEAGTRPVALKGLAVGVPDDLRAIRGIGRSNEARLHDIGVFRLAQIAKWTEAEQRWVSAYIGFPGRVEREQWAAQAATLLKSRAGPRTMRDVFRERLRASQRKD